MFVPSIAAHFTPSSDKTATENAGENGLSKEVEVEERHEIAIVGIEAHVCVTQTTIDLLKAGHKVYILADGVGSVHPQEVRIALDRLRSEGAVITTSESWLFEVMGDAGIEEYVYPFPFLHSVSFSSPLPLSSPIHSSLYSSLGTVYPVQLFQTLFLSFVPDRQKWSSSNVFRTCVCLEHRHE